MEWRRGVGLGDGGLRQTPVFLSRDAHAHVILSGAKNLGWGSVLGTARCVDPAPPQVLRRRAPQDDMGWWGLDFAVDLEAVAVVLGDVKAVVGVEGDGDGAPEVGLGLGRFVLRVAWVVREVGEQVARVAEVQQLFDGGLVTLGLVRVAPNPARRSRWANKGMSWLLMGAASESRMRTGSWVVGGGPKTQHPKPNTRIWF